MDIFSSQNLLLFLCICQLVPLQMAFFADSDIVSPGFLERVRRQVPGQGDKGEGTPCNMHSECQPGLACKLSGKWLAEYLEPRKCKPLNS